jgi:signal transduction histidine kinase
VAVRWRIRHKLMLGLGLVVGIIALLLAGTIYGLSKFRATMRSIDGKQEELKQAESVRDAVNRLNKCWDRMSRSGQGSLPNIRDKIMDVTDSLQAYNSRLKESVSQRFDADGGFKKSQMVEVIAGYLDQLSKLVNNGAATAVAAAGSPSEPADNELIGKMESAATDLCSIINDDLKEQSQRARGTFRTSMWIVCSTSLGGVLLLSSLLGMFYRWVFYPIRDLEAGAGRVAQGDFEHRIQVYSGDELEDLAAAFNDMTSRLQEMYRDLARQVNERSRQLVRSERLAGVGFLAAGVAHEINNPLASIAFCSEALEARLAQVLPQHPEVNEVVTKYLKMIQQEAFRCKAITQRLLEFSRGGERHREPADLVEIIQAVLDMVQHLQNGKGKQIIFEPTSRLVAWVNAQEIKSVVLNLVVNALDSMDEGGTLHIHLGRKDHMAEIEFADTGCGMSPEILENIFEPFFTRSRTGKGTGLGLSISHRVVSQHGGEIEATSPGPNQGSTFTVRLPLQPVESAKEETSGRLAA